MAADPPSRPTRPTRARLLKVDADKVDELHQKGVAVTDIAKQQGVNRRTIHRYLASTDADKVQLARFKANRADLYTELQAQSLNLQAAIIQSLLDDDGVLMALTPHQKTGLLSVLSAQHGTLYDKERLERGQSTSNVSVIHRLMTEAFERAGKTTTDSTPTERSTPEESPSHDRSTTEP